MGWVEARPIMRDSYPQHHHQHIINKQRRRGTKLLKTKAHFSTKKHRVWNNCKNGSHGCSSKLLHFSFSLLQLFPWSTSLPFSHHSSGTSQFSPFLKKLFGFFCNNFVWLASWLLILSGPCSNWSNYSLFTELLSNYLRKCYNRKFVMGIAKCLFGELDFFFVVVMEAQFMSG